MGKPEEEKRNQMMQNLFGDQSEDEEEEEEVDSGHIAASNHPDFHSDEGEGEAENDGEGEGEGEGEVEGLGEVEMESEAEAHDMEAESEGERIHTSQERETSYMRVGGEGKEDESEEEEEGYGQRVVTSRRREVFASESEGSEDNHFDDLGNEDEVDQTGQPSASPGEQGEQKDHEVVRDVFGDSDEDQPTEYGAQNELDQHSNRSPMEEDGNYQRDLRPEDIVPDEDAQYESEDENIGQKSKEKPVGPPLDMEILMRPPPGHPDRMNMIKVSNIMGIEAKAFDPKTYVEEDVFVTDESGTKKRIRLEDNIVRWRSVKNRNGTTSYESNARFVKWSDGSLQLLIGNEVLDISVQEANHDQAHLFLRHEKGILQSQGRLLRKMRFMPSSLSSKSHRLLTALVDSRHKKVYKVKNCVTDIDPEREKEEKEKVEGQSIKANELLHRKRAQVTRKYTQNVSKDQQLSTGYLEDALDEEDEREDYGSRRPSSRRRFEDDFDGEAQAEKRINNAKRVSRKPSLPSARPSRKTQEDYSESEREESEYETDGEDIENSPQQLDHENEYASEEAEEEAEAVSTASEGEPRRKVKEAGGRGSKRQEFELEDSPPQKAANNRRKSMVFDSDED